MNLKPAAHVALSILAVACAATAAQAQQQPAPGAPASTAAPAGAQQTAPIQAPTARAPRTGTYVIAAIGRTDYDYDCFLFSCDQARGTGGKFGVGYRIGVFGVEAWLADHGKADTDRPTGSVRQRTAGVSAIWTARFGDQFEGYLRTGGADVRQTRVRNGVTETSSSFEPTFGLGLGLIMTPQLSLELGWDITRGKDDVFGDVLTKSATLGLRLRF